MSESLASIVARIVAMHTATGTPLDSFTDSWKPGDLDDMCTGLGVTLAQARAAQAAMLAQGGAHDRGDHATMHAAECPTCIRYSNRTMCDDCAWSFDFCEAHDI